MAGAYVNAFSADGITSGTTLAATDTGNTTTGNALTVVVNWGTTNLSPTVDDLAGNTYTLQDKVFDTTNNQGSATFVAKNITGAVLPVITAHFSSSVPDRSMIVLESSGADTTSPVDQHTGQTVAAGTGTDAATSGNMSTTTNANDFLICFYQDIDGTSPTATQGTNYTSKLSTVTTSSQRIAAEVRNVSSTGAYAGTWTLNASTRSIVMVVALKDASSGAADASSDGVGVGTGVGTASVSVPASSDGAATATMVGAVSISVDASSDGVGLATGIGSALASVVAATDGIATALAEGVSSATAVMTSDGVSLATAEGQTLSSGAADASSDGVSTANAQGSSQASADATSDGLGDAQSVGTDASSQSIIQVTTILDIGGGATYPRSNVWKNRKQRHDRELEIEDEEITKLAQIAVRQISADYIQRIMRG